MSDEPFPLTFIDTMCPTCESKFDCVSNTSGGGEPSEGDVTICMNCGEVLVFNKDLKTVVLDLEEFIELPVELRSYIKKVQQGIFEVNEKFGKTTRKETLEQLAEPPGSL